MVMEEASLGLGLQTPSSRHWDGFGRRKIMVVATFVFLSMVMLPAVSEGLRRKVEEKGPGFAAKDSDVTIFEQPHRTGFHFQPQKNWMNDPNGLMYYKGYYHLFYQYNPQAPIWGNIVWGHAVSTDLLRWRYLEPAMRGDHWYDERGVWSGSATLLEDGSPVLLYTGESRNMTQVQNMAIPADKSDPLLLHWVKVEHNPVLVAPPGYNESEFRDPTTAWQGPDGSWRLIVGANAGIRGIIGTALLFKSKDFYNWEFAGRPLHSVVGTGMWECPDFYPVLMEGMQGLESSSRKQQPRVHSAESTGDSTPEQQQTVKYVLKISSDDKKHDYYSVGFYDTDTDTYKPASPRLDTGIGLRYDYGKFYASKSFFDPSTSRRILLGWSNESDSIQADISKGWSSIQAIPRKVWLDGVTMTDLLQWPIEEVESLRMERLFKENIELKARSTIHLTEITSAQLDIELFFRKPNVSEGPLPPELLAENGQIACSKSGAGTRGIFGPFGILVLATADLEEQTAIFFHFVHSRRTGWRTIVCSDQSRSSKDQDIDTTSFGSYLRVYNNEDSLALRILVDHSVVESFAQGGRTTITSRVYPQRAIGNFASVHLFNNSTKGVMLLNVSVWNMDSVKLTEFHITDS